MESRRSASIIKSVGQVAVNCALSKLASFVRIDIELSDSVPVKDNVSRVCLRGVTTFEHKFKLTSASGPEAGAVNICKP